MKPLGPLMLLSLTACASVGGMRSAPVTMGTSYGFRFAEPKVREAACEALRSLGMHLLEVGAPAGDSAAPTLPSWSALAEKGAGLASWGEYVRVTVLPTDSTGTTVFYILTRRALETNLTATGDWSPRLINRMGEVLAGRHPARPDACRPVDGDSFWGT